MIDQVQMLRKKVEQYGWSVGYRVRDGNKQYVYIRFNGLPFTSKLDRYTVALTHVLEVFPLARCVSYMHSSGATYRVKSL